jgi:hypothetical protein
MSDRLYEVVVGQRWMHPSTGLPVEPGSTVLLTEAEYQNAEAAGVVARVVTRPVNGGQGTRPPNDG